tara:strand:- start:1219 stop:1647 length:429 start_codon:yes stop_codon:yes gene_type:complete
MFYNLKSLLTALLLPALMTNNAFAKHSESHKHEIPNVITGKEESDIKPDPNEAILVVHGVVCSFCSFGIQKKLSKLDFVDTTKFNKKGSKVNIETQRVTVAIKQGSKADINVIFDEIKSGGYKPIKAYVANSKGEIKIYYPQ